MGVKLENSRWNEQLKEQWGRQKVELQNFVQVRVLVESHKRYEKWERKTDMGRWFHQTLHFWQCKLVQKDACSGSLYEKNCNLGRDTWMIEKLACVCCKAEDMESRC